MGQSEQKQELELNQAFARVFAGAQGEKVLSYLKSITVNEILSPRATDQQLRHREGERSIVAVIETRINLGRQNLAASTRSRPARPAAGEPGSGRQPAG